MKLENFKNILGHDLDVSEDHNRKLLIAVCPHDKSTEIAFRMTDQESIFGGCEKCKDILEKEPIAIADTDDFSFQRMEKLIQESGKITNDGPNKKDQINKFKMDYREACGENIPNKKIGAYTVGSKKKNPQVAREFTCRIEIYDRPDEYDFVSSYTNHEVKINKKGTISFSDTALVWALVRNGMRF